MLEEKIIEEKIDGNVGGNHDDSDSHLLFDDIKYICNSTGLITESLQKGFDVAQLPNGDIIVTEIKVVNVQYSWDKVKQKMVRISQT
jgi:hypothetical protein